MTSLVATIRLIHDGRRITCITSNVACVRRRSYDSLLEVINGGHAIYSTDVTASHDVLITESLGNNNDNTCVVLGCAIKFSIKFQSVLMPTILKADSSVISQFV